MFLLNVNPLHLIIVYDKETCRGQTCAKTSLYRRRRVTLVEKELGSFALTALGRPVCSTLIADLAVANV
jgi:hypothetical protein